MRVLAALVAADPWTDGDALVIIVCVAAVVALLVTSKPKHR